MINVSCYCPVERVVAIVNNIAKSRGASSFEVSLLGRSFTLKVRDNPDVALGCTPSERVRFLSMPEVEGSYSFLDSNRVAFESGEIQVHNTLTTSEPHKAYCVVDGKRVVNGQEAGVKCAYPEALTTVAIPFDMKGMDGVYSVELGTQVRPFYQFILKSYRKDKVIEVFGPKAHVPSIYRGVLKHGANAYPIYTDAAFDTSSDDLADKETVQVDKARKTGFGVLFVTEAGSEKSFVMGQSALFVDGKMIPYSDILKVAKFICALETDSDLLSEFEFACKGGRFKNSINGNLIRLRVEESGGFFRLTDDFYDFFNRYVRDHLKLSIFDRFEATDDSLFVRTSQGYAILSRDGHAASCFAMSLSYLLSTVGKRQLTSFFEALLALIDNGFLSVVSVPPAESGLPYGISVLSGTGSLKEKDESNLVIDSRSYKLKRVSSSVAAADGLMVMGIDTHKDGERLFDHYIVVEKRGESIKCVYDPYRKACIETNQLLNEADYENVTYISFVGVDSLDSAVSFVDLNVSPLKGV